MFLRSFLPIPQSDYSFIPRRANDKTGHTALMGRGYTLTDISTSLFRSANLDTERV
jgi:hypothetical protein